MSKFDRFLCVVAVLGLLFFLPGTSYAQETTGGLQGTVKDPSGSVVPGAKVVVTGAALVGKTLYRAPTGDFQRPFYST